MDSILSILSNLIVFFTVFFITCLLQKCRKPDNFPPGPIWLPVVGSGCTIKKLTRKLGGKHLAFASLAEKYGSSVIGLQLDAEPVVLVTSFEDVKHILTSGEFNDRPENVLLQLRCMGARKGITCADGPLWQEQRGFMDRHLRSEHFGKKSMEMIIQEEVTKLEKILNSENNLMNIQTIFDLSVLNILWTLILGSTPSKNDPTLMKLMDLLKMHAEAFDKSDRTLNHISWLRFFMPKWSGYSAIDKINKKIKEFFNDLIQQHHKDWHQDKTDNFIYFYITEMIQNSNRVKFFTDEQLLVTCLDFFLGGFQVTSNTLAFLILEMVLNPEIQDKAANLLNTKLDINVPVTYTDRLKVPYIEAIILESERLNSVSPILASRSSPKDQILGGYNISKDTAILLNVYSVHYDGKHWGDPFVFRPERFIDKDGKLIQEEHVINFSLGRRKCLGENLARQAVFIFFASIIRKFKICSSSGKLPSRKFVPGMILSPEPYEINIVRR